MAHLGLSAAHSASPAPAWSMPCPVPACHPHVFNQFSFLSFPSNTGDCADKATCIHPLDTWAMGLSLGHIQPSACSSPFHASRALFLFPCSFQMCRMCTCCCCCWSMSWEHQICRHPWVLSSDLAPHDCTLEIFLGLARVKLPGCCTVLDCSALHIICPPAKQCPNECPH